MKKISAIVSLFAFAFALSTPLAFARDERSSDYRDDYSSVNVMNNNHAATINDVDSTSSTGGNSISGASDRHTFSRDRDDRTSGGSAFIVSGAADAWAHTSTQANTNDITITEPEEDGTTNVFNNNGAFTVNDISASARTGHNSVRGEGNAGIVSGLGVSESSAMTLLNSNVILIKH